MDRSVGDMWLKLVVWVRGDMEELLGEGKVENDLLFMQRCLQLELKFTEWREKGKTK